MCLWSHGYGSKIRPVRQSTTVILFSYKMDKATEVNNDRMRDIASQQGNVVYEYVYDTPEREADETQTVKFAKIALMERVKFPGLSDTEARAVVLENEPVLQTFVKDNPKIFEMMTDKERCGDSFKMLCRLATFKRTSDQRGLSTPEATACVSQFLMTECQRPS